MSRWFCAVRRHQRTRAHLWGTLPGSGSSVVRWSLGLGFVEEEFTPRIFVLMSHRGKATRDPQKLNDGTQPDAVSGVEKDCHLSAPGQVFSKPSAPVVPRDHVPWGARRGPGGSWA